MSIPFIKNESPGYCVLITFYQFIKALNMSFNEFMNSFPTTPPKEAHDKRMPKWWDDIYSGRAKYKELQRIFFKEDDEGVQMYDICDPFLEGIFKIQNGMDINKVIDSTKSFDKDDKHYWDDKKLEAWYAAYKDKCKEVPFVCEWLNFMNKRFTWPDHVYITTMCDDVGGQYRIRAYNSDNQQGVVETLSKEMLAPLVFGTTDSYPDEGELPHYNEVKPGGMDIAYKRAKKGEDITRTAGFFRRRGAPDYGSWRVNQW